MTMNPQFIAVASRTRHYGYTVQDVTGQTLYFTGHGCTGGWYKYKRDAQKQADMLNALAVIRSQKIPNLTDEGGSF